MITARATKLLLFGLLAAACNPKITAVAPPDGGAPPAFGPDASSFVPPPATGLTLPTAPPGCSNGKCSDFPAQPIIDTGAPANAASMFAAGGGGAPPCLVEPEDGTLFPQQWLRPRVKWTGTTGLHRITIHSDSESQDLVVYSNQGAWVMPKDVWMNLSTHVTDQDIVVTVTASGGGTSTAKFQIAPVTVSGSMVFWAVAPDQAGRDLDGPDDQYASELRGFSVGDESTVSVLQAKQVMQPSMDEDGTVRPVRCMGCHAATPEDGYIAFVDDWPWDLAIAGVRPDNTGQQLPNLAAGGLAAMNLPWGGIMSFSKAYWTPGRRLVVLASSLQNYMDQGSPGDDQPGKLVWYNLDGAAPPLMDGVQLGEVARMGDTRGAACPTWSHDGMTIVYSATDGGNLDGALLNGTTDLYSVPFNDGKGGMATPLPGASDPSFEEYYPAFSPDDQLVAYTRVPMGGRMYANPDAELAVVKMGGTQSVRLVANDPPACSGKKSPGINNHWPKWAPAVLSAGGKTYYFLLFSSNRADIPPVPRKYYDPTLPDDDLIQVTQLYVSVVVDDPGKGLQTYPAIYLWNQPTATMNMSPIWENLTIPKVIN